MSSTSIGVGALISGSTQIVMGASYNTGVTFWGSLMPNSNAGLKNQALFSNGTTNSPIWQGAPIVSTGSTGTVGKIILTAGTATVSTSAVRTTSYIFLTDVDSGASVNIGTPTVGTITNNTSFVINSTNALDTSTVNWFIINSN